MFGWLTLVMLVLAIVGRVPRRLLGLVGLTLVLFALQSVFVVLRADYPVVAALHPVNGFVLLLVAIVIARSAWAIRSAAEEEEPAGSPLVAEGGRTP
jgi:hypothetical protein